MKAGIAALIQLRLVYHHTTPDGLSTYQANTQNAYNLVRSGKLVELAGRKFGSPADKIIEYLAISGYATASDLESGFSHNGARGLKENLSRQTNGYLEGEGANHGNSKDTSKFRESLRNLVANNFIIAVRDAQFQSPFDARQDTERHLHAQGSPPSSKAKKSQLDIDEKVNIELEKRLDGSLSAASILHELEADDRAADAPPSNQVCPFMDRIGSSLRRQGKTLLCVNYAKLAISIRDEKIASMAETIYGKQAAHVARAACAQIDIDASPFNLQSQHNPAAIVQKLDVSLISDNLADGTAIDPSNGDILGNGWHVGTPPVNGHRARRINGSQHFQDIDRQLGVLAEGPFSFIIRDAAASSWLVHKTQMNHFLRDKELMRLLGESVNGSALRIVRMLVDKGKLEEKTLQEVGLLGAKELRQCLEQMQMMGFLELQEVPREPQRQPNRTIFLWFYDAERVRKVFLGKLYKAMSRLFQRLRLERERLASTLGKIERSDVQGSEQEMLSPAELQVLYQWRQKEAWFMTEINRFDDSVVILGDL